MSAGNEYTLNAGIEAYSEGRLESAEAIFARLSEQHPDSFDVLHLLGAVYLARGKVEQAVATITQAIALHTAFAPAHANLGQALILLNRTEEALSAFEQAVRIQPDYASGWLHLAILRRATLRYAQAVEAYDRLLEIQPDNIDAHCDRGIAFYELGMDEQAVISYDRALALDPACIRALVNRGVALQKLGHQQAALASFQQALQIRPDYAEAWLNQGTLLHAMGHLQEALFSLDQAIRLNQASVLAWVNRGLVLEDMGDDKGAMLCFDQALQISPDHADANWNQSLCRLRMGDFVNGLPQYEWRHQVTAFARYTRKFGKPQWKGEPVAAKTTLLLHAEQGLGDAIQFVRYLPLVAKAGFRIILESPPSLFPLFSKIPGVWQCVKGGDPLPTFDLHCPLPSLPLVFATDIETLPADVPYLQAPPEKIALWQDWLGERAGLEIGLACSGNANHSNDHNRSIPLHMFEDLLKQGVRFTLIQKDIKPEDMQTVERHPQIRLPQLSDFSDTAALIELMDVIISVDTSVAHLAGAMGKPVWVLLPYSPDWRWLTDRDDSPWYPTARLFRQQKPGDWQGVITTLGTSLNAL